jgi:hypothetical protein
MATIFVSPGVYSREQDFSVFASRIGITRLGLVGKTEKGPAFEAIKVSSADEFALRFGGTRPEFPLGYVANSFLAQANDLTISRVLGKDGFTNSPAWLITVDNLITYTGATTVSGATFTAPSLTTGTSEYTITFVDNTNLAGEISAGTPSSGAITVDFNSLSSVTAYMAATGLTLDANWVSYGVTVTGGDNISSIVATAITFTTVATETLSQYSGATLAILRSKQNSGINYFDEQTDVEIGVTGMVSALSDFVISGTTGPLTAYTNGLTVSLDETKDNYIVKVLGKNPKVITGALDLYVEEIYPHFVREATARGLMPGALAPSLVYKIDDAYVDYGDSYTHSITPWIVSRVVGGEVHRLFKFHTISDGDASAREIKISIGNIDVNNYTFDVIVRRFEDTDATASSTALEKYSNVTLDETASNFIGKYIGTWDEEYPSKSMFITVELASRYPENSVPAGFEGYELRGTAIPDIFYKTTYFSGDSIFKTYLGVSELGYTSLTPSVISVKNSVKSVESDLFVYHGASATAITSTKGFHMENIADATRFVSGDKGSLTAYTKVGLVDKAQLKFTVVPAGGFDGFNKYRTYSETWGEFTENETSNYEMFKTACNVFLNPESVDINLFATPGVDYQHNTGIVKYALSMMEDRADTLYVIDAPRLAIIDGDGTVSKGTPEEAVNSLESTGIDSNYAATYWPWIQIEDTLSGKYTYQAPTLLAVKTLALTDNVSAPWFAPAGLNRATAGTSVKRTDLKLSKEERDVLYGGRINPIASFVQQGIVIWGQKTLQQRQSALDRINIRRLLLQVRRLISAAALTLLFEQNDQTLRDQFLAKVEPILLQIQNQRGLTSFRVVMDDSNNTAETIDRNMLIGKIQLKPTRTAEFIDLTFQVLPTGASFEDF